MLINLRNALMAGKRLPYDAEVEFLESTGTQYVDTGFVANSDLSAEVTMANAGTPMTNTNPMGAILATPRCRHHLNFSSNYGGVRYYFGSGDYDVAASFMPTDGIIFTYKVDAVNKAFTLGSFSSSLQSGTWSTGINYWLFARNGSGAGITYGNLKIYAAKLWNGSTLVRDFIPVRKGTVGYLYDRVSGKLFGNAGTGDFVLGPDVVPVEYIESHGTEWVNIYTFTGSETSLRYNIDFVITQNNSSAQDYVLGVSSSGNVGPRLLKYRTNFLYSCDTGSAVVGQPASLNQRYDIDFTYNSDGTIESIINGGAIRTYQRTFYSSQGKFNYLFGLMGNSTYGMIGRVYRMKMWVDATPIHSFLPVRVGTEGAMMDVLTRRIYRNAGTGAFTYGNDLPYPIPAS